MATYDIPNYGTVIACPYDKAHQIPAERMQKHLIKCRRQYPNAKIVTCTFNTTHHVPEQELGMHLRQCPDRADLDMFMYTVKKEQAPIPAETAYYGTAQGMQASGQPTMVQSAADEENWDDMDAPAYNPSVYCAQNPIIRKATHKTAAEKRQFYDDERVRHDELKKRNL
uniref:CHHC U11-48K-type domain-containing protein n=1 Tax=Anopheles dirus TaxID=7168 RepID=A0A182N333_9DIPT